MRRGLDVRLRGTRSGSPRVTPGAAAGLVLTGLIAILLDASPGGGLMVAPFLAAVLFFWIIHRPEAAPLWVSFLLGLLLDVLAGGILGVNALALMGAQFLAGRWVSGHALFWMRWTIFAVYLALVLGLGWLLASLAHFGAAPLGNAPERWICGVFWYPLLEAPLRRLFGGSMVRRIGEARVKISGGAP